MLCGLSYGILYVELQQRKIVAHCIYVQATSKPKICTPARILTFSFAITQFL
jgi:hypothetical protein